MMVLQAQHKTTVTIFVICTFYSTYVIADCTFRTTSDMGKTSPLILRPEGTNDIDRFFLPKRKTDILLFQHQQKVLLACPGKNNHFVVNGQNKQYHEMYVICTNGNNFIINGTSTHFRNIICSKIPESVVHVDPNESCGSLKRYKKVYIGFQLPITKRFIKLIDLCYDPLKHTTLYAKFKVVKGVENGQNIPRTSFFRTTLFKDGLSATFNNIYRDQKSRVKHLLGRDIISCEREHSRPEATYLQKGHLAAFGYFPYYSQKEATMYAINTVPQWSKINMANWKKLEDRIREYAIQHDQDLTVFVGTYSVLKLHSSSHKQVDLFLSDNGRKTVVPVPKNMYAVVYDQGMIHGIVFILMNNIFEEPQIRKICRDVCNQNKSFLKNWEDRTDHGKGYIYCCTLHDFVQNTSISFPVKPLLI